MDKPREYTEDECREMFLNHIRANVHYWQSLFNRGDETAGGCISGVAFSILVALDGGSINLPGFEVRPSPHPDDKEFYIKNRENYWPEGTCDIGGYLHELFHKKR